MAKCPYLDYTSGGMFSYKGTWTCLLTGLKMEGDNLTLKHVCDSDSGHAYEQCPVYKDK